MVSVLDMFGRARHAGVHIDYGQFLGGGDWNIRRIALDVSNTGIHAYLSCLHHTYEYRNEDAWKGVEIPTLIVHGTRDTFVPYAHAERLARMIPHARLVKCEQANHLLPINNFHELTKAIDSFLD